MTSKISEKKYYFKSFPQPGNWYGLISSSLDRWYLLSNNYQCLKILQLCFMRHELFYIVDLHQFNPGISIDNSNCLNYTLTNARRLHLELDVELKKLKHCDLVEKSVAPSDYDLQLQDKLLFCHRLIEQFEESFWHSHNMLITPWKQEIRGLEITKKFVENVFDDQNFCEIIDRDIREISFSTSDLIDFRKKILKILAFEDYDQSIDTLRTEIQKKISAIGTNENDTLPDRKISNTPKSTDMKLCRHYIAKFNYGPAQQILIEILKRHLNFICHD